MTRVLYDGRIELDTNPVERAIRPVALGRKNHLFAGSDGGDERWSVVCSVTRGKIELRRLPMDSSNAIHQAVEANMALIEKRGRRSRFRCPNRRS